MLAPTLLTRQAINSHSGEYFKKGILLHRFGKTSLYVNDSLEIATESPFIKRSKVLNSEKTGFVVNTVLN